MGDISADKKSVFLTNGETGKALKQMWVAVPEKNKIDNTIQDVIKGIEKSREKGYPMAADNLEKWLKGTAKPIDEFPEVVKKSKYVKEGLKKIFFYFLNNTNSKVKVSLIEFANNLKPEETRTWADTWETILELGDEVFDRSDMFFAFGSINLKSYEQFTVKKEKDGTIDIYMKRGKIPILTFE